MVKAQNSALAARLSRAGGGVRISDELQRAQKSMSYSDYVNDFINGSGYYEGELYSEQQVEAAYRTSVYLFAAMRRVANLFSEVQIVAEVKKGGNWQRLPETHRLNTIFSEGGAKFMYSLYMYYALYGKVLVYKRKTKKARIAARQGKIISTYLQGGIAGVHLIPNARWTIMEDEYRSEILGFNLNAPEGNLDAGLRDREEFVYLNDFDPRYVNGATSMASLAINNALTNASIARWASHYFMSGAMPLLLVSTEDDPALQTEADLLKYKSLVERVWQGLWSKFSLRAVFTDRKLNVQQAGIDADKVKAPELNQDALNAIASVFQITPDLIVPPPGGSQSRQEELLLEAYYSSVLPTARHIVAGFNEDFGLNGSDARLVIVDEDVQALDAARQKNAATETSIFQAGLQTFGEAQERLNTKPVKELAGWVMINGRFQSVERLLRDDKSPDANIIQYGTAAFDSNIIKRGVIAKMLFNVDVPPEEDGYKWQVVPAEGGGGGSPFGHPSSDTPPELPPGGGGAPQLPPGSPNDAPQDEPRSAAAEQPTPAKPAPAAPKVKPQDDPAAKDDLTHEDEATPTFPFATYQADGQPTPVTLPAATPHVTTDDAPTAWAYLALGNDPLVKVVADQLANLMPGIAVEWNDPATWHITLVYGEQCSDDQLTALVQLLPKTLPRLLLRAANLITFETTDGTCIALKIELDSDLIGLQNAVRMAFVAQNVPVSPFSASGAFIAHLTLGYAPAGTGVPDFTCSLVLEPQALIAARDDYDVVARIEPAIAQDVNTPAGREALFADLDHKRALMRTSLQTWEKLGEPGPNLRDEVRNAVRDALSSGDDKAKAWLCAYLACERGYFDDHVAFDDNPVLLLMNTGKAMQATAEDELRAWEKTAIRGGAEKAAARFEITRVPQAIAANVQAGLKDAKTKPQIRRVFSDARKELAELHPKPVDETILADWAERIGSNPDLAGLLDTGDQ